MNKILSVCIPTYNRFHYLKESLDALLPQAEQLGIDVCVSDNASSDYTPDYLKSLSFRYKCLRYTIQANNSGLDKNMVSALLMANSEYILPIGDDEIIIDGSLDKIINYLLINKPDLLLLNGWHIKLNSKSKPVMHIPFELRGKCFTNPIEAFDRIWDKMPLGSFVVNSKCISTIDYEKYLGTDHTYTAIVWEYLIEKFKNEGNVSILILSDPYILFREIKKSYYSYLAEEILYRIPLWFQKLPEDYLYIANKHFKDYLAKHLRIRILLHYRGMNQLNYELINKCSQNIKENYKVKIILNIPVNIAKIAVKLFSILRMIMEWVNLK